MASDATEIREAIEETRAQLGNTLQALADKADVKGRVTKKIEVSKERSKASAQEAAHKVAGTVGRGGKTVAHSVDAVPKKRVTVPAVVLVLALLSAFLVVRSKRQR